MKYSIPRPRTAHLTKFYDPPMGLAGNPEFKGWRDREMKLYAQVMKTRRKVLA